MDAALRVLIGVAAALVVVWASLIVVLVIVRPRGGLLRAAVRLLPDTIGLLRRLATDRSIAVGIHVRLWLLSCTSGRDVTFRVT